MSNIDITDIDNGSVIVQRGEFEDGEIAFGGADVLAPGTILARDTTNNKYQIYAKNGVTNGNGTPVAVLTYELTALGAGDEPVRPMVNGEVNQNRLIIDADGDASNVDGQVRDELRQTGIVSVDVEQLGVLDNPNNP